MLNFCDDLYVGEGIRRKSRIIRSLKAGRKLLSTYVLVLCDGPDQLEIYHNLFLSSTACRSMDFEVVGIAASYGDALEVVRQITCDCLESRGDADLKAFLRAKIS